MGTYGDKFNFIINRLTFGSVVCILRDVLLQNVEYSEKNDLTVIGLHAIVHKGSHVISNALIGECL